MDLLTARVNLASERPNPALHLLGLAGRAGADVEEIDTWVRKVLDRCFETDPALGALAESHLDTLLSGERAPYQRPRWPITPENQIVDIIDEMLMLGPFGIGTRELNSESHGQEVVSGVG